MAEQLERSAANQGTPGASTVMGGDVAAQAAVKRLKKLQQFAQAQHAQDSRGAPPSASFGTPPPQKG